MKEKKQEGYLIQLVTNKCNLCQRRTVDYQNVVPAKTSMDEPTPAQFKKKPAQWFYSCDTQPITLIRTDKTGVKRFGVSYYPLLKAYINQNNLKIKKEEDMIKLFNYFNLLLGE